MKKVDEVTALLKSEPFESMRPDALLKLEKRFLDGRLRLLADWDWDRSAYGEGITFLILTTKKSKASIVPKRG